ncbi:hypothetical protein JW868_00210 [Candidatus Woesearchaeota archaeon]|nr:hypothetical protein [Candidatus Woesearchaeota archaeon]
MEIKIDTSKDSKDDIRKMIRFLQQFIKVPENSGGAVEQEPELSAGVFSMFNDKPSSSNSAPDPFETSQENKEDDRPPKIEFF